MAKSANEIDAKVQEIYAVVRRSATPISSLSIQTTLLLGSSDWLAADVERVSGDVLALLIKHGWKKPEHP